MTARNTVGCAVSALMALTGMTGCMADVERDEPQAVSVSAHPLLSMGSQGMAVEELHAYLSQYGYFPSAKLAANHSDWKPVVTAGPAHLDKFDGNTKLAVEAFQKMAQLPVTGVVDTKTWQRIDEPRCGEPDGAPRGEGREKWAIFSPSNRWGSPGVTWKLINTGNLSRAVTESQIASSLGEWEAETDLTFIKTSGAADIEIKFVSIPEAATLAQAWSPDDGGDIEVDSDRTWTAAALHRAIRHEMGHALGLAHSSWKDSSEWGTTAAIMWPWDDDFVSPSLTRDDQDSISALYDKWTQFGGCGTEIASSSIQSYTWLIGCTAAGDPGNFKIYRKNSTGWTNIAGSAAHIAVDGQAKPWVVQADGDIFSLNSSGGWTQTPGCATDIAADSIGTPWVIGCGNVNGGHPVYKWNGSGWASQGGGAVSIAIGPGNRAWLINSENEIYRRNTANTGWDKMPGAATDIGGNWDSVWVIGTDGGIYVWDEQVRKNYSDGSVAAPARASWVKTPGGAVRVTADTDGPWVITAAGNIYHHLK